MDKKRMILASLASAAVLGAGFTATQQAVVKADDPIKTNSEQAAEAKKAAEAKVNCTPKVRQKKSNFWGVLL